MMTLLKPIRIHEMLKKPNGQMVKERFCQLQPLSLHLWKKEWYETCVVYA